MEFSGFNKSGLRPEIINLIFMECDGTSGVHLYSGGRATRAALAAARLLFLLQFYARLMLLCVSEWTATV